MKKHYMKFEITLGDAEARANYGYSPIVKFTVDENIPEGVEPIQYMRGRLREEINRHAASAKFDWENVEEPTDDI